MRVGVVGAGLSGLAAARALVAEGHEVVVIEKSRGVGGRMAARRAEGTVVDHGLPVLQPGPRSALDAAIADLAPDDRVTVASPVLDGAAGTGAPPDPAAFAWRSGMTRPMKALAEGLELVLGRRLAAIRSGSGGLELGEEQGNTLATVDAVVVSAPAPQAADLLERSPEGGERVRALRTVEYDPAVVVLAGVALGDAPAWLGVRPATGPLAWVGSEAAKGRAPVDGVAALVAHLGPAASARLLDASDEEVLAQALPALEAMAGAGARTPAWLQVKRWRYSTVRNRLDQEAMNPPGSRIVLCGDAVAAAPSVSAVYESGLRAAALLLPEVPA